MSLMSTFTDFITFSLYKFMGRLESFLLVTCVCTTLYFLISDDKGAIYGALRGLLGTLIAGLAYKHYAILSIFWSSPMACLTLLSNCFLNSITNPVSLNIFTPFPAECKTMVIQPMVPSLEQGYYCTNRIIGAEIRCFLGDMVLARLNQGFIGKAEQIYISFSDFQGLVLSNIDNMIVVLEWLHKYKKTKLIVYLPLGDYTYLVKVPSAFLKLQNFSIVQEVAPNILHHEYIVLSQKYILLDSNALSRESEKAIESTSNKLLRKKFLELISSGYLLNATNNKSITHGELHKELCSSIKKKIEYAESALGLEVYHIKSTESLNALADMLIASTDEHLEYLTSKNIATKIGKPKPLNSQVLRQSHADKIFIGVATSESSLQVNTKIMGVHHVLLMSKYQAAANSNYKGMDKLRTILISKYDTIMIENTGGIVGFQQALSKFYEQILIHSNVVFLRSNSLSETALAYAISQNLERINPITVVQDTTLVGNIGSITKGWFSSSETHSPYLSIGFFLEFFLQSQTYNDKFAFEFFIDQAIEVIPHWRNLKAAGKLNKIPHLYCLFINEKRPIALDLILPNLQLCRIMLIHGYNWISNIY